MIKLDTKTILKKFREITSFCFAYEPIYWTTIINIQSLMNDWVFIRLITHEKHWPVNRRNKIFHHGFPSMFERMVNELSGDCQGDWKGSNDQGNADRPPKIKKR